MRLMCSMAAAVVVAVVAVAAPLPACAEDKHAAAPVAEGSAACLGCHEDNTKDMLLTKHAVSSDARTPRGTGKPCQVCHGELQGEGRRRSEDRVQISSGKGHPAVKALVKWALAM